MSDSPLSSLSSDVRDAIEWQADLFITNEILAVIFEVHKACKTGQLEMEDGDCSDENQYHQVNAEGLDVFGHAPHKKSQECTCPNCDRTLAASRFAPHLEKCMGMGRNSSRIASRRIQNTSRDAAANQGLGLGAGGASGGGASDDDADDDWLLDRKKRKRDKNSPRRSRKPVVKIPEGMSWSSVSGGSESDKRTVLSSICGVVSEHTRKMCTRSMKCPQHTTNQRRAVREQVDVDSLEDSGVGASNSSSVSVTGIMSSNATSTNSCWDQDSSTTSPADSTSTVLSTHSSHSLHSNSSSSLGLGNNGGGNNHSTNGASSNGRAGEGDSSLAADTPDTIGRVSGNRRPAVEEVSSTTTTGTKDADGRAAAYTGSSKTSSQHHHHGSHHSSHHLVASAGTTDRHHHHHHHRHTTTATSSSKSSSSKSRSSHTTSSSHGDRSGSSSSNSSKTGSSSKKKSSKSSKTSSHSSDK